MTPGLKFSECSAEYLNPVAPALPVIEYHRLKFNGSLDFPSEYRGRPNAEIDAAWHRITSASMISSSVFPNPRLLTEIARTVDPMVVPADVVLKVGKSPSKSVKIDEKKREATCSRSRFFTSCIAWYVLPPTIAV